MDERNNEYGALLELMRDELKYYAQYEGQILTLYSDGSALCTVPQLGWLDSVSAAICAPVYPGNSFTKLKEGDYVRVFFLAADRDRPYYAEKLGGFDGNAPKNFGKNIIHEDAINAMPILYDANGKKLSIGKGTGEININASKVKISGDIELAGDDDNVVTFTALKQSLDEFKATLITGIGSGCLAGSGGTIPGMVLDISAAKGAVKTKG